MAVPKWPALTVAKLSKVAGRRCWHCGDTETPTVQHRAVKGTGGRRSADRPSNGLILCWAFNCLIESDATAAELARANGWKISTHSDPAKVPAFDVNTGLTYLIADDFTREAIR